MCGWPCVQFAAAAGDTEVACCWWWLGSLDLRTSSGSTPYCTPLESAGRKGIFKDVAFDSKDAACGRGEVGERVAPYASATCGTKLYKKARSMAKSTSRFPMSNLVFGFFRLYRRARPRMMMRCAVTIVIIKGEINSDIDERATIRAQRTAKKAWVGQREIHWKATETEAPQVCCWHTRRVIAFEDTTGPARLSKHSKQVK